MYSRRDQDGGGQSMFMTIPSSSVGAIIGKRGSRIREMEQTSGARIKIHDGDSDSTDRRIEIMGRSENQDSAKLMIEQVLDGTFQDSYDGDGYGGGGGGRFGGGGGGSSCFKCGESGHFARDCSSGGGGMSRGGGRSFGGGGGGGGGCYKCGESGHFARECNSGGSDSYGSRSDNSRSGSRW